MNSTIHIVMQGKGGVGKSVAARLLLEYMIAKGIPHIGYDADPVNQTFAAQGHDTVQRVALLEGSRIDPLRFDTLMNDILDNTGKAVILDTGASSFLPFMEYIAENQIIDVLIEEGFEVFLHTIVTGATSAPDTIRGFVEIANRFGEACNVIVWENGFFGSVAKDGKPFMDVPEVRKAFDGDKIAGRVEIERLYDLHEAALLSFLKQPQSFDQASAKENTTFDAMMRRRLKQLKDRYVGLLDQVIAVQEAAAVDA